MPNIFTSLEADTMRNADKIIKEKQKEADYQMSKAIKGDTMADLKYERARDDVNKAKAYLDNMTNKYAKRVK